MIHVIASIRVKPGRLAEFLDIFKANVPAVRREAGCLEYAPAVDVPTNLPPQALDRDLVTVIEKWDSVAALRDHLAAPHMLAYGERTREMVMGVSLKVLGEA